MIWKVFISTLKPLKFLLPIQCTIILFLEVPSLPRKVDPGNNLSSFFLSPTAWPWPAGPGHPPDASSINFISAPGNLGLRQRNSNWDCECGWIYDMETGLGPSVTWKHEKKNSLWRKEENRQRVRESGCVFTQPFIQNTFVKFLLSVKHCSRL